jgi:F-type H+-transporting ATPase subunit c
MQSTRGIEFQILVSATSNPTASERSYTMELITAAKYLGAGLACIGMGGAAIGVALVFGQFLSGALRNPSAAAGQNTNLFLGFALAEAFGIFSLLIAFLLLFVV